MLIVQTIWEEENIMDDQYLTSSLPAPAVTQRRSAAAPERLNNIQEKGPYYNTPSFPKPYHQ